MATAVLQLGADGVPEGVGKEASGTRPPGWTSHLDRDCNSIWAALLQPRCRTTMQAGLDFLRGMLSGMQGEVRRPSTLILTPPRLGSNRAIRHFRCTPTPTTEPDPSPGPQAGYDIARIAPFSEHHGGNATSTREGNAMSTGAGQQVPHQGAFMSRQAMPRAVHAMSRALHAMPGPGGARALGLGSHIAPCASPA